MASLFLSHSNCCCPSASHNEESAEEGGARPEGTRLPVHCLYGATVDWRTGSRFSSIQCSRLYVHSIDDIPHASGAYIISEFSHYLYTYDTFSWGGVGGGKPRSNGKEIIA
jgi:hypothetical protein